MNLLLDTHTLIWVLEDQANLSSAAFSAMHDGKNTVFVSSVAAWEIAIKRKIGKLTATFDYHDALRLYRFEPLVITAEHALATENLPLHHGDPFDRLLIAQAQVEDLTLVSRDSIFEAYEVSLIKA